MHSPQANILVVDDDRLHLTIYSWILQREGYIPSTALVGSNAVDFPHGPVDLVLLDYRLRSSLRAVDVAEQVKKRFPSAPIVVLSEMQWMPDDVAPHAVAFVHKGDPKHLLSTIASVLEKKRDAAA